MAEGTSASRLGPVLLLGAPGVGKGTQAQLLMDRYAVPQISTGDLLRENVKERTELGVTAELLMKQGKFVPDTTVNAMVAERLAWADARSGYILDGFPRTREQALWLDEHLRQAAGSLPLVAVQIVVPEAALLRRITGRRTCPVCRRIYNVHLSPPRVEGVCDVDGAALVHRSDDRDDTFAERMREFGAKTEQVIAHYRSASRFAEVDGEGSVDEVQQRVRDALWRQRRAAEESIR